MCKSNQLREFRETFVTRNGPGVLSLYENAEERKKLAAGDCSSLAKWLGWPSLPAPTFPKGGPRVGHSEFLGEDLLAGFSQSAAKHRDGSCWQVK